MVTTISAVALMLVLSSIVVGSCTGHGDETGGSGTSAAAVSRDASTLTAAPTTILTHLPPLSAAASTGTMLKEIERMSNQSLLLLHLDDRFYQRLTSSPNRTSSGWLRLPSAVSSQKKPALNTDHPQLIGEPAESVKRCSRQRAALPPGS